MKKRSANTIITLVMFFTVIMAFCAFAIDFTIILTQRAKLQSATESAAQAGASNFRYLSDLAPSSDEVESSARKTLSLLKDKRMHKVEIKEIVMKPESKAVYIKSEAIVPTYFLTTLGVGFVRLEAQSAARSEIKWMNKSQPKVLSKIDSVVYEGSVVVNPENEADTAILPPLGDAKNASMQKALGVVNFPLVYGSSDGKPLSLGAGGYITFRLPVMLVDKPGNDLYIKEIGASEGYFVFAGVDVDPKDPYINKDYKGKGIRWVNISCTGTPEGYGGAFSVFVPSLGMYQTKFYGSGYFDLGASCSDGYDRDVSAAKYIRIIDDNAEDGFMNSANPVLLLGEASSITPGADIDAVGVLNFIRLVKKSEFESLP